jgi:hypothetical protein
MTTPTNYEAPALRPLGSIDELTAGGQGTGDGTGSIPPDATSQ